MKKLVSRPTTAVQASFNSFGNIPTDPMALLFFNNVIFLSVSRLDRLISDIHDTGLEHELVKGWGAWSCSAFNFSAIVEKKQIISLAFSVSFTAKPLSSRFNGPIFFLTLGLVALDNTFQYAVVVFAFFSWSLKYAAFAFLRSDVILFLNLYSRPMYFYP